MVKNCLIDKRKLELLKLLITHGKLTQFMVGKYSNQPFATARRNLEQLRKNGFVMFEKGSRNSKIFSITEKGKKIVELFQGYDATLADKEGKK